MAPSPRIIMTLLQRFIAILIMIQSCFVSRNVNLLTRAFITYVRPLLEYNCVAWSPHVKGAIKLWSCVYRQSSVLPAALKYHLWSSL